MDGRARQSLVPWLSESDLCPAGPSAWSVDTGRMITRGWTIDNPFGREPGVLVVTAIRGNGNDGGTITLSLADELWRGACRDSDVRLHDAVERSRPAPHSEDGA